MKDDNQRIVRLAKSVMNDADRRRIECARADIVLDPDDVVVQDRDGIAPRPATAQESKLAEDIA